MSTKPPIAARMPSARPRSLFTRNHRGASAASRSARRACLSDGWSCSRRRIGREPARDLRLRPYLRLDRTPAPAWTRARRRGWRTGSRAPRLARARSSTSSCRARRRARAASPRRPPSRSLRSRSSAHACRRCRRCSPRGAPGRSQGQACASPRDTRVARSGETPIRRLASAGIGRYLRSRRLTNPHDRLPSPMHRARSASRPKPLLGTVGDAARRSRKFAGRWTKDATGSRDFVWTSTISGCRAAREREALAAGTRFRAGIEARSARRLSRR